MEEFTNMKPVVVSPKASFQDLVDEIAVIEEISSDTKDLRLKQQIDQIITKLHRKKQHISNEQEEQFKSLSGGLSPDDFINKIREQESTEQPTYIKKNRKLFQLIDGMKGVPKHQLISDHEDQHVETVRDYEVTYNGSDYLEKFREYILENQNKVAAIEIICNRPKQLTRQALKELQVALSLEGFDDRKLNTAWKNAKNEEIATDIIAYIRSLALGSALIAKEDRIKNAMKKVRSLQSWTQVQKRWLERFENQLLQESILQKEDLNSGIFKREGGGYVRLNKVFGGELETVLGVIQDNLYSESA